MKTAKFILALSLLANVALAVVWYWPRSVSAPPVAAPTKRPTPAKPPALTREQELAAALAANPEFVEAIRTGAPKPLREALTRAGFPAEYVRDMVTFFTGNTVTPEHLAMLRLQAGRPFWKIAPGAEELALKKLLRERDTKNSELTKEAFGGKIPPHPLEAQSQQRRYRFLPEDKIARVAGIDSDYGEKMMAIRSVPQNDETREKLRLAAAERREALTGFLTPAELELYDLNVSSTTNNMRRNLTLFQPTEAEFRAIYEIRRGLDEKYDSFGGASQAEMQQRAADQKIVDERIRGLLGDQRYDEYTRAQDYGYRAAVEIAAHFNLPPATAVQAYSVQQDLVKRWGDASASPDAKAQAAALLAEANTRLSAVLGPAGYDAYKKTGGRMWMMQVERTANPPAPGR